MNDKVNDRLKAVFGHMPNVNEQIVRLAKEADCNIDRLGYGEGNLEKFAQLIISEVTTYLDSEIGRLQEYQNSLPDTEEQKRADVDLAIEKCLDNILGIKEHFGVS